jgi:hypothetical protein
MWDIKVLFLSTGQTLERHTGARLSLFLCRLLSLAHCVVHGVRGEKGEKKSRQSRADRTRRLERCHVNLPERCLSRSPNVTNWYDDNKNFRHEGCGLSARQFIKPFLCLYRDDYRILTWDFSEFYWRSVHVEYISARISSTSTQVLLLYKAKLWGKTHFMWKQILNHLWLFFLLS